MKLRNTSSSIRFFVPALALVTVLGSTPAQANENWISSASLSSSKITLSDSSIKIAGSVVTLQSSPSSDCPSTSCANVVAGNQMFVFKDTKVTSPVAQANTINGAFEGTIGSGQTYGNSGSSHSETEASTVDIYFRGDWVESMPAAEKLAIEADLQLLASTLQPLATTAGDGHMVSIQQAVDALAHDFTSRPIARLVFGSSKSAAKRLPNGIAAEATSAPITMVFLPAEDGSGLLTIETTPAQVETTTNGTDPAASNFSPAEAKVTLLPGLVDSIPISASQGKIEPNATFSAIAPMLAKQVTKILGSVAESQASSLKVDGETGGLTQQVTSASGTTCFFEASSLQTCIEVGEVFRNETADSNGVGIGIAPIRIGSLRQQLLVTGNKAFAGVNTQGSLATTDPTVQLTSNSTKPSESEDNKPTVEAKPTPTQAAQATPAPSPKPETSEQAPTPKPTAKPVKPLPNTGGSNIPLPLLTVLFIGGVLGFIGLRKRANSLGK